MYCAKFLATAVTADATASTTVSYHSGCERRTEDY